MESGHTPLSVLWEWRVSAALPPQHRGEMSSTQSPGRLFQSLMGHCRPGRKPLSWQTAEASQCWPERGKAPVPRARLPGALMPWFSHLASLSSAAPQWCSSGHGHHSLCLTGESHLGLTTATWARGGGHNRPSWGHNRRMSPLPASHLLSTLSRVQADSRKPPAAPHLAHPCRRTDRSLLRVLSPLPHQPPALLSTLCLNVGPWGTPSSSSSSPRGQRGREDQTAW